MPCKTPASLAALNYVQSNRLIAARHLPWIELLIIMTQRISGVVRSILAVSFLANVGLLMVLPSLPTHLGDDLRWSSTLVATALLMKIWCEELTPLPAGFLIDRFGPHVVLSSSVAIGAAGFAGLSWSTNVVVIMMSCGALGAAVGLFRPSSKVIIVRSSAETALACAVSLRHFAVNLGVAVGPLLAGAMAIGNSMTYQLAALTYVFCLIQVIALRPRSVRHWTAVDVAERTPRVNPTIASKARAMFGAMMGALFIVQLEFSMPASARQTLGAAGPPAVFGINAALIVLAQPMIGRHLDSQTAVSRSFSIAYAFLGTGFISLYSLGWSWLGLVISVCFVSIGEALLMPAVDLELIRVTPRARLGVAFGMLGIAGAIGGSIGTAVMVLTDQTLLFGKPAGPLLLGSCGLLASAVSAAALRVARR